MITKTIFCIIIIITSCVMLNDYYEKEVKGRGAFKFPKLFSLDDDFKQSNIQLKCSFIVFWIVFILTLGIITLSFQIIGLGIMLCFAACYAAIVTAVIYVFFVLPWVLIIDLISPGVLEMVINDIKGVF